MSTDVPGEDRVRVGRLVRPHGLDGAMVLELETDHPEQRFSPGSVLYTEDGGSLTVERFEPTDRSPLVTFVEAPVREDAERLRDTPLLIPAGERRELEEGEFWPDELVGMAVYLEDGSVLGRVGDVETGVGQDRLAVETEMGEVMIPFVEELVPEVDREANRLVVSLPEGLID